MLDAEKMKRKCLSLAFVFVWFVFNTVKPLPATNRRKPPWHLERLPKWSLSKWGLYKCGADLVITYTHICQGHNIDLKKKSVYFIQTQELNKSAILNTE